MKNTQKQPVVEYIICESGDWVKLKLFGDVFYEGHSVPDFIWIDLLQGFIGDGDLVSTVVSEDEL